MNSCGTLPYLKDVYPLRAQYRPGDDIALEIELCNPMASPVEVSVHIDVFSLEKKIASVDREITLKARSGRQLTVAVDCSRLAGGFGVDASLFVEGKAAGSLSTAFDIVRKWNDAPRYGFLSDFYKEDEHDRVDVEQLRKYHINAVQFYDWMYRHHDLIPPQEYFTDPMSRKLSLKSIRNKVALCHESGMKAFAYGAVYTASREFAAEHPRMMLYRNDGEEETFGGGWQNIMDVSAGSEWSAYIVSQYERAVRELDFDGIHMDTYGFPKTAFAKDGEGERFVRLDADYPALINRTKAALLKHKPDAGVIFNAVGDWPTMEVANTAEDAVYVEVWPPCDRYVHLHDIVERARRAGKKPVILAAYVKPFKTNRGSRAENALRLAQAAIFASGGYHFVLGENNAVLCDSYYVDYAVVRRAFERTMRNYCDFIVRYTRLLYSQELKDVSLTHANGINEEYAFGGAEFSSCGEPGKVWTIVKEMPGAKVIHFINLMGIASDRWNEGKPKPKAVENIRVRVLDNERALGVYTASPDGGCRMERLVFETAQTHRGRAVEFMLPFLEYWSMVYIATEH
jgi:dextranase